MLKSIKFKKDWRCFKAGDVINFHPLTLLVGDQGCGKSTVLGLLMNSDRKDTEETVDIKSNRIETRGFDYEKSNPRISSWISTPFDVYSRFGSHGEFVRALNDTLIEQKGVCWLLDEPDSALSIRSAAKLADSIKTSVSENKCQLIASIHSPIIIKAFNEVYSLEHRKWMFPDDFIQSQLKSG